MLQELFKTYTTHKKKTGQFPVDNFMPSVSGTLRMTYNLTARLTEPVQSFKTLQHP